MTVSVRSCLTAGVATLTAGVLAVAPVHAPDPASVTVDTVRLSAAVTPLAQPVNSAAAALGLVDAGAGAVQAQAAVQPYNAASNVINAVYSVSRYWANYMSLDLGPWLIGWIPGGYLINDQIYIWYPTFTLPVVDSFVYDFLDPVVNDPLNPAVWSAGLSAIANTAWNGVVSGVQQEINYLLTLQWFPIPLPPFPPFPFAATAAAPLAPAAADTGPATTQADEVEAPAKPVASGLGHSRRTGPAGEVKTAVAAAADAIEKPVTPAGPEQPTVTAEPDVPDVSAIKRAAEPATGLDAADRSPAKPEPAKSAPSNDTAKKSVGKSGRAHRAQKSQA